MRILSPLKKSSIFSDSHKELVLGKWGRPWELNINRESVVSFLHQPDISNCSPGWKEVKYCKIDGKKDYQAKHHLLYNIKELGNLYNEEHKGELTYYQMHEIISSWKHTDFQNKTPKDDCRCENCENSKLFLEALKKHFKQKQMELSEKIETSPKISWARSLLGQVIFMYFRSVWRISWIICCWANLWRAGKSGNHNLF